LEREDGLRILSQTGWLSTTPPEFRDKVLTACRWRRVEAGALITLSGENAADVIGGAHGVVALTSALGVPDSSWITLMHAVFWIGYGPIMSGKPRRVTAIARTEVWLASLSPTVIKSALARRPEWWEHMLPLALEYGDYSAGIAADLAIRGSARRCAAVLMRLGGVDRFPAQPDLDTPILVPITQDEVAVAANLSRNTVGKILADFAKAGLIATGYGGIMLTAPSRLMEFVEMG